MLAADNGHLEVARSLLEAGADKDTWSHRNRRNALMLASGNGHLEVPRLLLQAGTIDDCYDYCGMNAAMSASLNGRLEVTLLLLSSLPRLEVARFY